MLLFSIFIIQIAKCQDTFSIVAVDILTGEIGCAAASCVDLRESPSDDFLGQIIPGIGVIITQASYDVTNQSNATARMSAGETPVQIIKWLVNNDVVSNPTIRQYGIAAIINGVPQTASHTGSTTPNYHNQILGSNYAIQGNTILGNQVLLGMETGFLNQQGDLKCKLMAAMQGAKMAGADNRCTSKGVSSLFAFIKVGLPSDTIGSPSILVSARTNENDGIEPIDVLQEKFNALYSSCSSLGLEETTLFDKFFKLSLHPSAKILTVEGLKQDRYAITVVDKNGKNIYFKNFNFTKKMEIDITKFNSGVYFLKINSQTGVFVKKIIIK